MSQLAFGYGVVEEPDADFQTAADRLERRILDYCKWRLAHLGWAGMFVDGPQNANVPPHQRVAGREMLRRTERGDHIILTSLSASFHRRRDLLHFLDYVCSGNLAVHFLDEGVRLGDGEQHPADSVASMLRALDRASDEPRRRAIRRTLHERKMRGLPKNGESPIGFKLIGKGAKQQLVPDEQERAVMRRIYELRHGGGLPFPEILLFLRKEGVRYRRNGKEREWSESRCRRAYEAFLNLRHAEKMKAEVTALVGARD